MFRRMSAVPTAPSAIPPSFGAIFARLIDAATGLLTRIAAATSHQAPAPLPKRYTNDPARAQARIAHAAAWLAALRDTLAGKRRFVRVPSLNLKPLKRYFTLTRALRGQARLPQRKPATPALRDAAQRRYIQRVFATQPIARIAKRLARRLDLRETDPDWPAELLTLTQTPAAYCREVTTATHRAKQAAIAAQSAPAADGETPRPPFHRRE